MRLPCILLRIPLLLLLPLQVAAQDRTSVHLFQYGSANTEDKRAAFLDFYDLMGEKLPRLASEILSEQEVTGVADLSLEPVPSQDGEGLADPKDFIKTLSKRRNYIASTGALALLTGRVKQSQDDKLAIRSTFFFGEEGLAFGTETIDVELPFTAASYDTTQDSHSVAVLYALAIDFSSDCAKHPDVFFLLSQAKLRADAVAGDDPALGDALGRIVDDAYAAVIRQACPVQ